MMIRDHRSRAKPPRRRSLAAAAAACLVSACATVSPPAPSGSTVPLPAAWSSSASAPAARAPATSLAQWWGRFNDPLLSQLIEQALLSNSSVVGAQATLRQSRALVDVQSAALVPVVKGSTSAQRNASGSGNAYNTYQAGFDASWEPDVFGGTRAGVSAASADAQASGASLGDVQVSVAAEVAVTYVQLRGVQARWAIARANLASQEETLQLTQWRAQAGLASSLDVEQARASVEQTRAQIPSLDTTAVQSQHALAVLTGQAPAALRDRLAAAAMMPTAADDLVLDIPAETLRQRPDVRAAEAKVGAAAARVTQADVARYPSFQLTGSLGLNALTLGSLTSGASVVSALLGSVSLPLFDGGAARAQVRAQEASLDEARASYQAAVLTALKDVEDALVALRNDRTRLVTLQTADDAAQNAALLARQRYASGVIDFQTVLETQRTALNTQDSVAVTAADLQADHVRLYKALGGGWEPQTNNPDTVAAPAPQRS